MKQKCKSLHMCRHTHIFLPYLALFCELKRYSPWLDGTFTPTTGRCHLLIYTHPSLPLPCCLRMFYFMIHFVLYTRLTPIGGDIPEMQACTSFSTLHFGKECAHHALGLGHYHRPECKWQVENEHKCL
jgi:hypothetical protein